MTKPWLSYANLSDRYERKARFLPAFLSVLPLLPMSAAFSAPLLEWVKAVAAGVGVGAVLAVAISHIASACGNRLQLALWPDWPHDSPTNRWLHPEDQSVSVQQKQRLYRVIKSTLGLNIQEAIDGGNPTEVKTVINDSVGALRNRLWQMPLAERLRILNEDYGFARNLTGLRVAWCSFALLSMAACWYGFIWQGRPLLWAVVSTIVATVALLLAAFLPRYVRTKAHYYAESFFEAVVALGHADNETTVPKGE